MNFNASTGRFVVSDKSGRHGRYEDRLEHHLEEAPRLFTDARLPVVKAGRSVGVSMRCEMPPISRLSSLNRSGPGRSSITIISDHLSPTREKMAAAEGLAVGPDARQAGIDKAHARIEALPA